jgi:ATP phosphoribosyltransferase regulatory subunit
MRRPDVLERPSIRLPVGVRDFLPRAAARRRALAEAFLGEFEHWGYERIITPAFEYADVLARGMGADARAIHFVEPATGEVVALRPDITPQVARLAATRLSDVGGPIRLSYEGSVLRLTAGARGQRELIQAGVELLDAPSPDGDAEVLSLAAAALHAAGIDEVTIDVGHVALARAAFDGLNGAARSELRSLVGKKDQDAVGRLAATLGLPPAHRKLLEALPSLWGDPQPVLARARKLAPSAEVKGALVDLERALELAGPETEARFTLDLGEVRGFEYYTGLRFAAFVPGAGDAVLLGGRYDDLVARYGRNARATGFAIDVEAVAQAQKAAGIAAPDAPPGALIVAEAVPRERAFHIARAMRAAGARVAVDLGHRRGDHEIRAYAAGVGLSVALVLSRKGARYLSVDGAEGDKALPVPADLVARAEKGEGAALSAALHLSPSRRARRVQARRST